MKIDRLIGILSLLLQKEKLTSSELAEKFEVSQRTILRDIDTLNLAGIPVVSSKGHNGGISIMKGYKVDSTLLSSDDMKAILSGLSSLDSVSGTNRYRQLMEKLSADDTAAVNADNHIIIDLSKWNKTFISEKMELIKKAMEQRHTISFRYFSPNGESDRNIEPYHLVFQWSSWYVWGYCIKRDDYRMFKLTRMTDLTLTDTPFEERDVPEYTCDKMRNTKGDVQAEIRFDKSQKWRLIDEFGTDALDYDENGDILLFHSWENTASLYRYILSFGESAEVLAPEELRTGFAQAVKNISGKYQI